jgi:heme exporter protein C
MIPVAWRRVLAPPVFLRLAERLAPWLGTSALVLITCGLVWGLALAPADRIQGEGYRILYIHVPAAWLSLFVYVTMAGAAVLALVWRIKLAELAVLASAPVGMSFTFLALVTGSLWGKPMWGTFWVWGDARLTSELVMFFLYLGVMALAQAIEEPRRAARAAALLAIIGVINVPIIHFSVLWWNTLHQGPTVFRRGGPAIATSMLLPLLANALGFTLFYGWVLLLRMRVLLLHREHRRRWAIEATS